MLSKKRKMKKIIKNIKRVKIVFPSLVGLPHSLPTNEAISLRLERTLNRVPTTETRIKFLFNWDFPSINYNRQ